MENQGATVVISHHIFDGKHQEYEDWLEEIVPLAKKAVGFIDLQIIRPIPNLTFIYTVIIRFDAIKNLKNWMESEERKKLIDQIKPVFSKEDNYQINSGLDFLFAPENTSAKPPAKWKQFLITWSAIFPLSIGVPLLILPLLRLIPLPKNHYFDALLVTACIVFLMVYVVMPNYTKLIKNWLYK